MFPELTKYNGTNPTGFYMSEKLNGVFSGWDGRQFISKNGKPFAVPPEIVADMPVMPMDGELYADGDLGRIAGLCRRKSPAPLSDWHGITFQAFDVPEWALDFQERLELLIDFQLPDFCRIVEQTIVESPVELLSNFSAIKARGGEGLVLKSPAHKYRPGPSELAFKAKYVDDFEVDGITVDENGRFICVRDYE